MVLIARNPALDGELTARLIDIWAAVTNAGGAVGFTPPVTPEDVLPTAEDAFARVRAGVDDLVVATADGVAVGFGFLATNEWPLTRHWGSVKRLQRHPEHAHRGVGTALLAELEAAARARGLERLVLTVRGGTGREGFYLDSGFTLDARLPGRLRLAPGDDRDELHLSKVLAGGETSPRLEVHRLDADLPLPSYAHPGDAGLDLRAREPVTLGPGDRAVVPTGVAVAVPPGCVGLVHPRSGLAARHGLGIVNAPGTVDAGYRGEVRVVLINHDPSEPVPIERGDRIAQLVVQKVETVTVVESGRLPPSARGDDGFGSTGA